MHFLISTFILFFLSFPAWSEQGTLNTDDDPTTQSEASMSGTRDEEALDIQEEEVRIEDDEYDPAENEEEGLELDEQKMEEYENQTY